MTTSYLGTNIFLCCFFNFMNFVFEVGGVFDLAGQTDISGLIAVLIVVVLRCLIGIHDRSILASLV